MCVVRHDKRALRFVVVTARRAFEAAYSTFHCQFDVVPRAVAVYVKIIDDAKSKVYLLINNHLLYKSVTNAKHFISRLVILFLNVV